jgi:hypothetical protein
VTREITVTQSAAVKLINCRYTVICIIVVDPNFYGPDLDKKYLMKRTALKKY